MSKGESVNVGGSSIGSRPGGLLGGGRHCLNRVRQPAVRASGVGLLHREAAHEERRGHEPLQARHRRKPARCAREGRAAERDGGAGVEAMISEVCKGGASGARVGALRRFPSCDRRASRPRAPPSRIRAHGGRFSRDGPAAVVRTGAACRARGDISHVIGAPPHGGRPCCSGGAYRCGGGCCTRLRAQRSLSTTRPMGGLSPPVPSIASAVGARLSGWRLVHTNWRALPRRRRRIARLWQRLVIQPSTSPSCTTPTKRTPPPLAK